MALTPLPTFPPVPAGPDHLDHSTKMQQALEALHSDVPDEVAPLGLVANSAIYGDGATDATAYLQGLIDDALAAGSGSNISLPVGDYNISAPLTIDLDGDVDVRIHLQGSSGRRGTRIVQTDDAEDVFQFHNAQQNLRGLTVSNLALYGGRRGVSMRRCSYLLFDNVTFHSQAQYGVYAEIGTTNIFFHNCWWVHGSLSDAAVYNTSGDIYLVGCLIGEDAGGIVCIGGTTHLTGGKVYGSASGGSVFTVEGGNLLVTGTLVRCGTVSTPANSLLTQDGGTATFDGCSIFAGDATLLDIVTNGVTALQGSTVRVEAGASGSLYASADVDLPAGVIVSGNTFQVDPTVDLTWDPRLGDPAADVILGPNVGLPAPFRHLRPRNPDLLLSDTFDRTGQLNGSTADTGQEWSSQVTGIATADGRTVISSSANRYASIDAGASDLTVAVTRDEVGVVGLAVRHVDDSNFLAADVAAGVLRLRRRLAGTFTILATSATFDLVLGWPLRLTLTAYGDSIIARAFAPDGAKLGEVVHTLTGGDEVTFASATGVGWWSTGAAGAELWDFEARAIG